jgi:putative AbiEii toxin of type IV toxin-antitoxin system/uncharacterized protein DUF4435
VTIIHQCKIPLVGGTDLPLHLETGRSIVIIGANGSGKTRLGVLIEDAFPPEVSQRIAAQKSLALNDKVSVISLERAQSALRTGYAEGGRQAHRVGHRWNNKPATHLLSDFDALQQTLFAHHNHVASKYLQEAKLAPVPIPTTKLEELKAIWDELLPHRVLEVLDSTIKVLPQSRKAPSIPSGSGATDDSYHGSEMSDGERAIFYFIGQCLVAPPDGLIIVDEPESHVHTAIVGLLWDAIEKSRPDCGFIYITHNLEFAITRPGAAQYFIRAYDHSARRWEIEQLPQDTGLPEHVVAEIVGSRKPILFVEGERGSLDLTIYRSHYHKFTIIPIGSCEAVIHSVASYKGSASLHWLGVRGLVDGDDRDAAEIAHLLKLSVFALPVAEVENLLLLPDVFLALAEALLCDDPVAKLAILKTMVMAEAKSNADLVSARYTTRQLDRRLKRIEVGAKDLGSLQSNYQAQLAGIDPATLFNAFKAKLLSSIQSENLPAVLQLYDNKGLLARAATLLVKDQKQLTEKLSRLLGEKELGKKLRAELSRVLPVISI